MKHYYYFFLLSFCFTCHLNAQILNGQIIELETGEPIGYSKLGVLNQNYGAISNSNGFFHLDLSDLQNSDTLLISAIGYEQIKFLISHCRTFLLNQENLKIELTPIVQSINEVVVTAGKYKKMQVGNNIRSPLIIAGFQNRQLGAEMGTVMKYNKKRKGLLTKLHFNIVSNTTDTIKFRVNIYEFDKGEPGENVLSEPIYFRGVPSEGSIEIDVEEMIIHVKNDYLVTIELIENVGMEGLFFKSAFLRSPSYFRETSEGDWTKANVDLGFWSEITYKK